MSYPFHRDLTGADLHVPKAHTHTESEISDIHAHTNKVVLDLIEESFTTVLMTAYDLAVTKAHEHANKVTLDAIQEAFTTVLKNKLDGIEDNAVALTTVKADSDIADAISKKHVNTLDHTQGTDQKLDEGGGNEVTVADVKDAVDKKHTAGTDPNDHAQNGDTDLDATFEDTFVKKADNVNVLADITSAGADIEDAVSKKHTQGTDTELGSQSENLDMNTHKIVGVVDPDDAQDVSTKNYVDSQLAGENHWDRESGDTIVPYIPNSNIDLGSGDIDTTGDITGGNVTSGESPGHLHDDRYYTEAEISSNTEGSSGSELVGLPSLDATPATLRTFIDGVSSSLYYTGGIITENSALDGTVDISEVSGAIKLGSNEEMATFTISAIIGMSLTGDGSNTIIIDYDGGTPIFGSTQSEPNHSTVFSLGSAYREATTNHLHIVQGGHSFTDMQWKTQRRFIKVDGLVRASGLVISESDESGEALAIAKTAGKLYKGITEFSVGASNSGNNYDITAVNTGAKKFTVAGDHVSDFEHGSHIGVHGSTGNDGCYNVQTATLVSTNTEVVVEEVVSDATVDGHLHYQTFRPWYYNGSDWVNANQAGNKCDVELDDVYYNDISSGFVELTANRYGVHWIYQDTDGHLLVVYGQGNYTLNQALEVGSPSNLPDIINKIGFLIAKVVIKKNAGTFYDVFYPWTTQFSATGATEHGGLGGLEADDHEQYVLADGTRVYTGTGSGFKDEDNMVSDSAVATASQQSIKKYVDDKILTIDDASEIAYTPASGTNFESDVDKVDEALDELGTDSHTHANQDLLDTYTQTEVDIADAISKEHEHSNKAELDKVTDGDHDVISSGNPHNVAIDELDLASGTVASDVDDAIAKAHDQNTDTDLDATFELTFVKKTDTVNVISDITSAGADIEDAVTKKHVRSHAIDDSSDHTSTITENNLIDADASGLPDDSGLAVSDVSDAVSKKHDSHDASTTDFTPGSGTDFDSNVDTVEEALNDLSEDLQALDTTEDSKVWQEPVLDKDLTTPPESPSTGDRYIVATGATGVWSTHWEEIAEYNGSSWDFIIPSGGFMTFVEDENEIYIFDEAL